jgi:arsenate reductase (thioredoxin)
MKNVYFLCSGDSNRAQLAQGFAEVYLKDSVHYMSTSFPDEKPIQPLAVFVMREIGIDIARYDSPSFNMEFFRNTDYIISICEDALDPAIPIPKHAKHIHIQIDDPLLSDDYVEQLQAYRQVRDQLGVEIKNIAMMIAEDIVIQ